MRDLRQKTIVVKNRQTSIYIGTAVLGCCILAFTLYPQIETRRQINSKLEAAKREYIKLGIEPRSNATTKNDEQLDYLQLLSQPSKYNTPNQLLELLEIVARGSTLDPNSWSEHSDKIRGLFKRLDPLLSNAAKNRDWKTCDRIFKVHLNLSALLISMSDPAVSYGSHLDVLVWDWYEFNEEARQWYRKKLESDDMRLLVRALLSGTMSRVIEQINDDSTIEPAFKKHLLLTAHTHFNKTANQLLKMKPLDALGTQPDAIFLDSLSRDHSPHAAWLVDTLQKSSSWRYDCSEFIRYRIALIHLDLFESKRIGRAIEPTWSKGYCYDPILDAPILIKVKKNSAQVSSKSANGSYWFTEVGL